MQHLRKIEIPKLASQYKSLFDRLFDFEWNALAYVAERRRLYDQPQYARSVTECSDIALAQRWG